MQLIFKFTKLWSNTLIFCPSTMLALKSSPQIKRLLNVQLKEWILKAKVNLLTEMKKNMMMMSAYDDDNGGDVGGFRLWVLMVVEMEEDVDEGEFYWYKGSLSHPEPKGLRLLGQQVALMESCAPQTDRMLASWIGSASLNPSLTQNINPHGSLSICIGEELGLWWVLKWGIVSSMWAMWYGSKDGKKP